MQEREVPAFRMTAEWDLPRLTGYLHTWSAIKRYQAATGVNPVNEIYDALLASWGNPGDKLLIQWPLTLKLWTR